MINLIAAVGNRGQLGLEGNLPWYNPEDLAWFKALTMGQTLVVGHRTAQTLPPLPGRTLLVMERDMDPAAMKKQAEREGKDLWIIGGAATYERWMPHVDRFFIARIDYDGPADTWLPPLPF